MPQSSMLKRSTSLVKSTLLLEYLLELWSNLIEVSECRICCITSICFLFKYKFSGCFVYFVGEETLTGGSACKWYLNEDIAEIDEFFERYVIKVLVCNFIDSALLPIRVVAMSG